MALITCRDLSLAYENKIVVQKVNFSLNEGDYLCIVGENGSGKSTLVMALLGLKQPAAGSIERGDGLESTDIGYLPQQSAVQRDFPASVREVVLSGCRASGPLGLFYTGEDRRRAGEKMALLGLRGLERACYRELSGGQQQRVLLARALCAAKRLLILDEPAASLDPAMTAELYGVVRRLNAERGLTVVMVSHDLTGALSEAKQVLHLDHAQEFFGPVADYRRSPAAQALQGGGRGA